jgi:hypothetical protein
VALAPALFDSKGRVRRDHVTVSGKDEVHPEGSYFIEWWEGGKRYREAVGANGPGRRRQSTRIKQAELAPHATALFRPRLSSKSPRSARP